MPKQPKSELTIELEGLELRAKVEKAQADARKARAEADKAEADVANAALTERKLTREADKIEVEMALGNEQLKSASIDREFLEMRIRQARVDDANTQAQDFFHKRYVFDKEVSQRSVDDCIARLQVWTRQADAKNESCTIELVFNSPGGSIIPGMALLDYILMLQKSGHTINTVALGMAASMAAILLQAGNKRSMGENAVMLIHEASFGAGGSYGEVQDTVKMVDLMHARIVALFCKRSGMKPDVFKEKWSRRDWWLSAAEALDLKLIDAIA